ncbi:transporter, MscS family [Coleofasciculus chthonoplastes PCC 7420]|uniref:Transporter, MscS family n=1 Tax=Coleofasciculus chthonoplastes PCC 7420 TaxID=118168 RepID=B4VSC4_9CYAN|nr:mechanosensitive ion channel family protein [Coleofasciculus chthonoplastes]EDX75132.1 transporter, MscS family [Coleofasciculus chthonoplastes PCC 7420]
MRISAWTIAGSIALAGWVISPVQAQIPGLPDVNLPTPNPLKQQSEDTADSGCVRLDGRCLFEIAAPKSELPQRIQEIEQRLQDISQTYFKNESAELEFRKELDQPSSLPEIYVSLLDEQDNRFKEVRLMSVTNQDADLTGVPIETRADEIIEQLEQQLPQAKQERQPAVLTDRVGVAVGTGVAMIVASLLIYRWERRLKRSKQLLEPSGSNAEPISTQLTQNQQRNVKEVLHRLLQLTQGVIWVGGSLLILSLFPYTRPLQILILASFRIPVRVGIVGLGTYVIIRLSYALTDRFSSAIVRNHLLTPESAQRSQLRVSTVSGVTKNIITLSFSAIGLLVALAAIGIDIGPLLAGAGIIGLGLSLASQNLIKDAINGFFILLEDQYAVGDVITVGDVGGFVEMINLRITQLRDAEGRLITVPNSEVRIVANLSSNWSRADLNIPVTYQADVDKALDLVRQVAHEMLMTQMWRERILDEPDILGVDNFGDRGFIIRVWIKTQPLKQWEVAREFRRRLKAAFDEAGILLSVPQQALWFNNTLPTQSLSNGHSNGHGHQDVQAEYAEME